VQYSLNQYKFVTEEFFPPRLLGLITEVRVNEPQVVKAEATGRLRRQRVTEDGKLTILAADHPARRVTGVGDDPLAMADRLEYLGRVLSMADRLEYLGRVLRVIAASDFDGVMGPTDIIEELFIVNHLVKQQGHFGLYESGRPLRHRLRDGRPLHLLHRGSDRSSWSGWSQTNGAHRG